MIFLTLRAIQEACQKKHGSNVPYWIFYLYIYIFGPIFDEFYMKTKTISTKKLDSSTLLNRLRGTTIEKKKDWIAGKLINKALKLTKT